MVKPLLRVIPGGAGTEPPPVRRAVTPCESTDNPLVVAYAKLLVLELRAKRVSESLHTVERLTTELLGLESDLRICESTGKQTYLSVKWPEGPWTLRNTVVTTQVWENFIRVAADMLTAGNYREGREALTARRRIVEAGESYRVTHCKAPSCMAVSSRAKVLPVFVRKWGRQESGEVELRREILLVPKLGPEARSFDGAVVDDYGHRRRIDPALWSELERAAQKNFALGYGCPE